MRIILFLAAIMLIGWTPTYGALLNNSFESPAVTSADQTPDNWGVFDSGAHHSGVTTAAAMFGSQSLGFEAPGDAGSYRGYFQAVALSGSAGRLLDYVAFLRSDAAQPFSGGATAKLGIEFRYLGSETNRQERLIHPADLTTDWQMFSVQGTSASLFDEVNFTIVVTGDSTPNSGVFYVDDTYLPEPAAAATLLIVTTPLMSLTLRRRRENHANA